MQYIQTTTKSVQEVLRAIEETAPKYKFGVLSTRNMKETLHSKGFELKDECYIIDICNPSIALTFLKEDMLLSSVLPCKISVYAQEGETTIVMNSLTQMVDDINPDCLEIAQEAQATLQTIIDEASTK